MAFTIDGGLGLVTVAGGASATDLYHLIMTGCRPATFTLNDSVDPLDTTGFAASLASTTMTPGLIGGTAEITCLFPKTTPLSASSGLVTISGTDLVACHKWNLDISWPVLDITAFGSTAPTNMIYRPGRVCTWKGGFSLRHQNDAAATALPALGAAGSTAGTTVFKLIEEGGTDSSFTGSIYRISRSKKADPKTTVDVDYTFQGTGNITAVGSAAPLPAGAIDMPDWDATGGEPSDGIPDISLILQYYTGRTDTVPGFLSSVKIDCQMNQLVKVVATVQLAGAIVSA